MTVRIRLSGALDFETVPELWSKVRQQFRQASVIELDCGEVSYCNSAALALLLECIMEGKALQKTFRVINIPSGLMAIASACGVKKMIEQSI